ncbi:MAG: choice-of-anchor D domain-containing protein [Candidatus Acidiferrales bacterium]
MRTRFRAEFGSLVSIRDLSFFAILLIAGPSLVGCALTGKSSSGGGNPGAGTPAISVTPSSASFGNVTVNTDATQTMKLSNTGTADLSISKATITGTGFSMSGLTAPATVAAGASMNFTVAFKPTAAVAGSGSVSITSDASSSPMTINLTGTGVSASIKLTANATSLSFGDVLVGKSVTQDIKLTNTGNANIVISGAVASGTGFSSTGGSNTTLTPNQSATVAVSFDPQSKGPLSGSLTVNSNAPKIQISLAGTGTQASQQHTVSLSWTPSISQVIGYFVYRRTGSNGSFSKVVSSLDTSTSFTDSTVADGQTYFYVVTALSAGDVESEFSDPVSVTIPSS